MKYIKNDELCSFPSFESINYSSYNTDGLQFETAWEVLGQKELQAFSSLMASLSIKHSQAELDHALHYFQQYILDFPGEFFLQTPFIFTVSQSNFISTRKSMADDSFNLFQSLLQLIDCETQDFDHTPALTTCLKLTQSLARRLIVRRVPCMSFISKEVRNELVSILKEEFFFHNFFLNKANTKSTSYHWILLLQDIPFSFKFASKYLC